MKTKEELLREGGYRYNYIRLVYLNRADRKVFSVDWLDDHSEEELAAELNSRNDTGDWQIYSSGVVSESVRTAFLAEIDGRPAAR
ncbi:MAG TPA: hypothetical protein VMU84_06425 [Thermoanaerobaculia bacterium]|nr:hypothetical protein [Thermoanaerobaculia bacterium]